MECFDWLNVFERLHNYWIPSRARLDRLCIRGNRKKSEEKIEMRKRKKRTMINGNEEKEENKIKKIKEREQKEEKIIRKKMNEKEEN